jgi:hypothetical protein
VFPQPCSSACVHHLAIGHSKKDLQKHKRAAERAKRPPLPFQKGLVGESLECFSAMKFVWSWTSKHQVPSNSIFHQFDIDFDQSEKEFKGVRSVFFCVAMRRV